MYSINHSNVKESENQYNSNAQTFIRKSNDLYDELMGKILKIESIKSNKIISKKQYAKICAHNVNSLINLARDVNSKKNKEEHTEIFLNSINAQKIFIETFGYTGNPMVQVYKKNIAYVVNFINTSHINEKLREKIARSLELSGIKIKKPNENIPIQEEKV